MSSFCIREANKNDIETLLKLEESFGSEAYSRDMILDSFDNGYYYNYVIEVDNLIIGYISYTIIFDECNLLKIVIDDNYRMSGYGKKLFESMVLKCKEKEVDKIFLEVRTDNITAKKFYQKIGFVKESIRAGYYNGIDAEILWYYIND